MGGGIYILYIAVCQSVIQKEDCTGRAIAFKAQKQAIDSEKVGLLPG